MVNPIRSATVLLLAATTIAAAPPPPRIGGGPLASMHGPAVSPRNNFGPEIRRSYNSNHDQDIWIHDVSLTSGGGDPVEAATAYARSRLTSSDFVVKSAYTSDLSGATHVYLRQKVNGLEVVNGNLNMNVDKHGRLVSYGDSFVAPNAQQQRKYASSFLKKVENGWHVVSSAFSQIFFNAEKQQQQQRYKFAQAREPVIEPSDAILSLLAFVQPGPVDPALWTSVASLKQQDDDDNSPMVAFDNVPHALSPVTARQAYIQTEGGELLLVWDIEIEMRDHWYSAYVNAHDGTVVGLVDWVADASDVYYNVIPFGFNDPSDTLQQMVYNPYDAFASPEGWHAQSTVSGHIQNFNVTVGNNVYAHTNPDGGYSWEDNYRPMGKLSDEGDLYFDYVADFERQEPNEYEDAAVTNLFYWCNIAHDLFYRYGFDEKAGNFQQDNLGRGRTNDDGANDAVIANAQDGSGRNNANFATPPDGRHGKMRMYVWDETFPMRDGDFESGIVIHEYTHGVSNRLTNGPHDSNCLGWGEAGGMGEGWGDFVATIIRMNENDTRESEFGMGGWASGDDAGIRKYKYSTSMKTNPSTYKIMDRFDYWGVHAKGEVWAVMLYEIYWNLVDAYGFTPEWFPPLPSIDGDLTAAKKHILSHGNTLALQLVIDGMKLQPCNPSFVDARDAILDADKLLTEGANYCLIYAGFAKRGLGVGAKLVKEGWLEHREESFDVPEECQ